MGEQKRPADTVVTGILPSLNWAAVNKGIFHITLVLRKQDRRVIKRMLFICSKKEAVWMWSRQLDLETLSFGISFPSSIITTFSPVSENSLSQTCPDLIPKDRLLMWISLQTCSSFSTSLFPFLHIFSKKITIISLQRLS